MAPLVTNSFEEVVENVRLLCFPRENGVTSYSIKLLNPDDITKIGEYKAIPEGLHVQFSACESNESAVEVAGEEFLQSPVESFKASGGNITYYSLRSPYQAVFTKHLRAKPRIYVTNNDQAILYSSFLNKPIAESSNAFGEVTYNDKIGWQVNRGAIHGVSKDKKTLRYL
jgi:hypothetical protein